MKKPDSLVFISIIVPVYNREKTLNLTLHSLFDQIYRPIELILVDNNSQDRSYEICKDFQDKYSHIFFRIKVIQETKKGANAARNAGLAIATGEYIMFFDSDDIMYNDCVANVVGDLIIEKFPTATAYPFFIKFPDGTLSIRPHIYSKKPADQLYTTIIPTHGICIKRETLNEIGPWDEQIERWQDLEFGFRVMLHIKDLNWFTAKPLYEVQYHDDSISGNSYFTDHKKLYASLIKIGAVIEEQAESKQKCKQQRALCYKICSLASQIRKEGHPELGNDYLQKALLNLPKSRKRLATGLLYFQFIYEGKGGRGFWKIARILM